jgi:hypothetical protein
MLNIKNLIIDAYRTASIVGEISVPNGAQTNVGINELNDVIYQCNLNNYLPFTRTTISQVITTPKDTYTIGLSGCDITNETPVLVSKVYFRNSSTSLLTELKRVSYESIFGFKSVATANGTPCLFSYDRTWPNGRFVYDINPSAGSNLVIIFNTPIQEVTINDIIDIPNEYNDLFKNMLAVVLMNRYKVDPQAIAMIQRNVDATLNGITSRNNIDKIITYSGDGSRGPLRNYYNLFSPHSW